MGAGVLEAANGPGGLKRQAVVEGAMPNRVAAAVLAGAFLLVFLLTPPGRLALDALSVVPQTAWGWALGFVAFLGFLLASRQALRRGAARGR